MLTIILPLHFDVTKLINDLYYNKDEKLLDIEAVLSFIFYAFSINSNLNDTLHYSIVSFKNDFLLNEPEITENEVMNTLNIFKELITKLHNNLLQYGVIVNEQLPYDFCSFLSEKELIIKSSKNHHH